MTGAALAPPGRFPPGVKPDRSLGRPGGTLALMSETAGVPGRVDGGTNQKGAEALRIFSPSRGKLRNFR